MPTIEERLAALESLAPKAEVDPLTLGMPEVAVARLVVGGVDGAGRRLPGTKEYTATEGTLEDLCRLVGVPAKVVEAASKAASPEAVWSGKGDDLTIKAL